MRPQTGTPLPSLVGSEKGTTSLVLPSLVGTAGSTKDLSSEANKICKLQVNMDLLRRAAAVGYTAKECTQ